MNDKILQDLIIEYAIYILQNGLPKELEPQEDKVLDPYKNNVKVLKKVLTNKK